MIHLIGDRGDWKRIDSSLVKELNREAELGEKVKRKPKTPDLKGKPDKAGNIPDLNLDGFIYVPSAGIYLAKKRTLNNEIWDNAIKEIYEKGVEVEKQKAEMPTPFEFMSGLIYVLDNKNIPNFTKQERAEFLDDILKIGYYRGNWLNARFVEGANCLNVESACFDSSGKLSWKREKLEACLSKSCYADIRKINRQGLFTTESANQNYVQGQTAYFWRPEQDCVAGFGADSGRAGLDCYRHPGNSNSSLGVRLVVRLKA